MKSILQSFLICFLTLLSLSGSGQTICSVSSLSSTYKVKTTDHPYTTSTGIVASLTLSGASNYVSSFSSSCGGTTYATTSNSILFGAYHTNDSIIFDFSSKVTNFSVIINGTDPGETITVTTSTGTVALSNYCSASFSTPSSDQISCGTGTYNVGTLLTIDNPTGATRYIFTHNGVGAGSLLQLLDCITSVRGPANVNTGIQLWLDGTDVNNSPGTNPADGTKVPVWKDISGNGNNATVLSGQDTAKMHSAQINGKDVILFKRVNSASGSVYKVDNVDIRATSMPQTTIFTVYRQGTRTSGDFHGIWGNDDAGWDRFFISSVGANDGIVSVGPPVNSVSVTNSGVAGETKLLTTVYHSGVTDSSVVYFNAVPVARVTDNSHPTAAQSTLRIGWDGDNNPYNGDIAEMVVYNRKLTECEIKAVNRYFGYKYNVTFTTATITPSAPQYLCSGSSVTLSSSTGTSYKWMKDNSIIASATSATYIANATGSYRVIVNSDGCDDTSAPTKVTIVDRIYVDSSKAISGNGTSWDSAVKTVTEALYMANQVSCATEIWVRKGTYFPTAGTSRDSSFRILRNNIKLYGGFAGTETLLSSRNTTTNLTQLSGDINVLNDSTDNSYHVVTIIAAPGTTIDTNTVVDGFTILKGQATGSSSPTINGQSFFTWDGAGLYNAGFGAGTVCSPKINDCKFKQHFSSFGSALYNGGSTNGVSSPMVSNCVFENNYASSNAGVCLNQGRFNGVSSPTFTNCTFSNNGSPGNGGAFYNNGSSSGSTSPVFNNCTFTNNYTGNVGGAVFSVGSIGFTNNASFISCTFTNNTSLFGSTSNTRGGALYNSAVTGMTIKDCKFFNNTARAGGGAICNADGSTVSIEKTLFSGNSAVNSTVGSGGALVNLNNASTVTSIINSVFTGNSAGGTSDDGGGAIAVLAGTLNSNNNTFYNNTTASTTKPNGNTISTNSGSTTNLNNTIIWGTATNQANVLGTVSYNYSLVKGLSLTAPNLTVDPQFVNSSDPDGADNSWGNSDDGLKLTPCSPAVNAGNNSLIPSGISTDFAAATRIQVSTVDMGAYEQAYGSTGLPDIAITASPSNKVCEGTLVSFPATTVATGTSPSYKWYKNGVLVSTSPTYSSSSLVNKDSIWVIMTNTDCNLSDTSAKIAMTITAPRMYVDSAVSVSGAGNTWATAFKTLTEALNVAHTTTSACPTEIWVKKGTYFPTTNTGRDSSFRIARNYIKVYGGFAGTETLLSARSVTTNPTILSGDLGTLNDSTDNAYHVLTIIAKPWRQIDTNTIVDGFTITKGNGLSGGSYTYDSVTFNRQDGAGAFISGFGSGNSCKPLIANCTFTRNAANYGGAIYDAAYNAGNSSPYLRNNTFSFNRATFLGGAVFNNGQSSGNSSPNTESCTFSYNKAENGGGMFNQAVGSGNSTGPVNNCVFNNNSANTNGGALYNYYAINTVTSTRFYQNTAVYSGGAFYQEAGKTTFTKNVFDENTAQIGGAVRLNLNNPSVAFFRNVFFKNISTGNDAGAMSLVSGTGTDTVINNLFIANKAFGTVGANGGGAIVQEAGTSTWIVNNTFYADTSTMNGAAIYFKDAGTNRFMYNNIFYKNYNGSAATDHSLASGTTVTASNNLFSSTNPRFINETSPIGTDGIWLTSDDGLDLIPCSPAVNVATTAPATDILNRARLSLPDIGAYEEQTGILPTVPVTTTTIVYCQGQTPSILSASKSSASDTLKWYNASMVLLSGAPTPSTATAGTFTWHVSQTNATGCESNKVTITVTVNPTPVVPTSASPVVYCQNATASALTATATSASDTLKWYDATPTLLGTAPTPVTTSPATFTFYVSQKNSFGCEGPKKTITVQVNPTPTAPTVTTPVTYCQTYASSVLTATKSAAADTLKWYDGTPTLLSVAPTPSTATAGTFVFYVSEKNNFNCESPKATINVIINPTPATPVTTTAITYCQGVTASALSATLATGADALKWYDASMTLLAAAPTPSTATVGTTTYYVSQKTALNCESPKATIVVTVNPTPVLPTSTSPVTYCQNELSVALTATKTLSSDTLKWYDSVPSLLSGAPTPSTAAAGTFTFYVSQKNLYACESGKRTITVQVNPTPIAPASTSPVTYCQDETPAVLTATKGAASNTLQWYNASLTLLSGAPTPSTTVPGTYTYYVSDKTSLNCEGPKTKITVQVNPKPTAPTVVTPVNLCVGVAVSPLTATGTNLKWYTAASGGTGVSTVSPPNTAAGTFTYYVSQTTALGCEGPRATMVVNMRANPVVTLAPVAMPAYVFCVDDSISIKATTASTVTYLWQRNSITIPGSVKDTLHISTTANYTVIVKDIYGCADTESAYVMKNPLPRPTLSPIDVAICKGVSIMLYSNPSSAGYKYEWFRNGLYMGVDTAFSKTPVDTSGVYTVRVTDIYNCIITTNPSNVTQYPAMIKPTIVRTGSLLKLTAPYTSYQWYRNGKSIPGANASTYLMSFDGIYHVVVNDNNNCSDNSDTVSVNALGISNVSTHQYNLKLYPNPTQAKVFIEADEAINVIVTDVAGREVWRGNKVQEVDLAPFADGLYLFRILNESGAILLNQKVNKMNGQ